MFTASIIAALVAAGVATAKAIGKGVQAKKQRESREEGQAKHLSAMEQAAQETGRYREQFKAQGMEGMQHQMAQMQPLFDIMTRAGASAGYQAPDMSWLMQQPQARANVGGTPGQGGGGARPVKSKKQGGNFRTDPTGPGPISRPSAPQGGNFRTETGGTGAPSTTGGPR